MKTALVTGSNRGLGREIARALRGAGWELILHTRSPLSGGAVTGDLCNPRTVAELGALGDARKLSLLVNNAAEYRSGPASALDAESVIASNLIAPMVLTARLLAALEANHGRIVNINSIAALDGGGKGESAYAASKAGLAAFARCLRKETSVQILDVYLGAMRTEMMRHRPDWDRLLKPEEVAAAILAAISHPRVVTPELVIRRA